MHVAVSPGQCSYPVVQVAIDAGTAVPTDVGANMWVAYIGLEIVSRDETHQNGWDYDRFTDAATTFYGESTDRATFYGDACRRLSGDAGVPDVAVVGIDCPLPPLPL